MVTTTLSRRTIITRVMVGAVLIVAVLLRLNWENREWHQPYGGCKEALPYPDSVGYSECQEHGYLP